MSKGYEEFATDGARILPSPKARLYLQVLSTPPHYYATCCFDCMEVYTTLEISGKYVVCDKCKACLPWLLRLNAGSWEGKPTAKRMVKYAKALLNAPVTPAVPDIR